MRYANDLVIFVRTESNPVALARLITTRIESFEAHILIVFGSGYAKRVVNEVLELVQKEPRDYDIEVREELVQIVAFIFTPEMRARISHWSESFIV